MSEVNNRTVKVETPWGLVVVAVAIGLLVLGGIVFAVWVSSTDVVAARLTGTVVAKEFIPLKEEQITFGEDDLRTGSVDGNYTLTVDVPMPDGTVEPYTVERLGKARWEAVKVGDSFDVGPLLVK